jgi:RNA polymerase sigma-70 factor (ECF subfamily)
MVLDSLSPSQRVAFVLHDVFAVPFDEIAQIVERSPEATRQLASRARRRVQNTAVSGAKAQRSIVDAFFSAARDGDFEALVAVLDPDLVLRVDAGKGALAQVVGADAVARQAMLFADPQKLTHQVLVNDRPGVVVTDSDLKPLSVMTFTVRAGKIVAIDSLIDVDRLRVLDLPSLD